MAKVYKDRVWFTTATTGTGTLTVGSGVSNSSGGYLTPAQAGVNDGDTFDYVIIDGSDWEMGTGTYTAAGTTLSRSVTQSYISGTVGATALTLSGTATVFLAAPAQVLPGSVRYASKTANYTIVAADRGYTIELNTNSATFTLSSPSTLGEGWWCIVKNNNAVGVNTLTVTPSSGTIDGVSSSTDYPGAVRTIYCDGANFRTILNNGGVAMFTASGTFVAPNNFSRARVILQGAGGGGGAGQSGATATARMGGTGGGGGARIERDAMPSEFGAAGTSNTVTVGTGGTGGTGVSGASGGNGTVGGNTSFTFQGLVTTMTAYGGGGGKGGAGAAAGGGTGGGTGGTGNTAPTAASAGGLPAQATNAVGLSGQGAGSTTNVNTNPMPAEWGGGAGGGALTAGGAGGPGGTSLWGGPGGGGGAGITTANAAAAGGAGGLYLVWSTAGGGGPAGGTTAGTNGTAAFSGQGLVLGGSGGAGGGTNGTSTRGAGSAGLRGGGGGGGAAALTGTAGGNGGNGGNGFVAVIYN